MLRKTIIAAFLVLGLAACAATSPQTTKLSASAPQVACEITTVENFMNTRISQFPEFTAITTINKPHQIEAAKRALRAEAGPEPELRDFDTIIVVGVPGQPILGLIFTLQDCFQGEHVGPADSVISWLRGIGALPTTQRNS